MAEADLHGRAFHDYHRGRFVAPFEYLRDDGDVSEYDIAARFAPHDALGPRERWALERVHGRILDVGCGAGRHLLAFAAAGHDAVGVDASPLAVEVTRARGAPAELMRAQALRFPAGAFDCVTFFSNGLSMGATPAGVRAILRELHRVTGADGAIVMENIDVTRARTERDRAYVAANRAAGRPAGEMRLRCRYREISGSEFRWLLLEPGELDAHLAATGWRVAEREEFPGGHYCARIVKHGLR